jgi:hypothetical protein
VVANSQSDEGQKEATTSVRRRKNLQTGGDSEVLKKRRNPLNYAKEKAGCCRSVAPLKSTVATTTNSQTAALNP